MTALFTPAITSHPIKAIKPTVRSASIDAPVPTATEPIKAKDNRITSPLVVCDPSTSASCSSFSLNSLNSSCSTVLSEDSFPTKPTPSSTASSTAADSSSIMKDPPFMMASPIMMVSRNFDIRRVYNSQLALRLSVDVPKIRPDTLVVFVKHTGVPGTLPYVMVAGTTMNNVDKNSITIFSRKLYLAAECVERLGQVEAKLSRGVLEILAPKTNLDSMLTAGGNRFSEYDLPTFLKNNNKEDGEPYYCKEVKIQHHC